MAQREVGVYRPNIAEDVLNALHYLRANGFLLGAGDRGDYNAPPNTPLYVKNDSGEQIPAFACVQVTGTKEIGDQNYFVVDKPQDTTGVTGPFLFTLFRDIEENGFGIATAGPAVRVLCSDDSPETGRKLVPQVDSWQVTPGNGLLNAAGPDDIRADVVRAVIQPAHACDEIQFLILTAYSGSALALITEVPCGCDYIPGLVEGTTNRVIVYDTMGCLLIEEGMYGFAHWMESFQGSQEDESVGGSPECYWSIKSLCCPPE